MQTGLRYRFFKDGPMFNFLTPFTNDNIAELCQQVIEKAEALQDKSKAPIGTQVDEAIYKPLSFIANETYGILKDYLINGRNQEKASHEFLGMIERFKSLLDDTESYEENPHLLNSLREISEILMNVDIVKKPLCDQFFARFYRLLSIFDRHLDGLELQFDTDAFGWLIEP